MPTCDSFYSQATESPSNPGQFTRKPRAIHIVTRVRADANSPKGIRITMKPILSQAFLAKHSAGLRWVGLRAEVSSQGIEPPYLWPRHHRSTRACSPARHSSV